MGSREMNYEQKYNASLEQAKKELKTCGSMDCDAARLIFRLFPQLKESEDERIRKELIGGLMWQRDNLNADGRHDDNLILPGFTMRVGDLLAYLEKLKERGTLTKEEEYTLQRIIEYLEDETCPSEWISLLHDIYCLPHEKQNEQKPNIELIQRSWYMDGYIDGEFKREPRWNLKADKGGPKYEKNEKYGQPLEQKPVNDKAFEEWIDGWYNEHHRDGYITMDEREFKNFCRGIRNMYQQKPAGWSEEDENMRWNVISIVGESKSVQAEEMMDWLKSLPEKFNLQPSQEWSKEDEMYLSQAIEVLEHENYLILADKLKSLRSSWKPSEEQIEALDAVYKTHGMSITNKATILKLLNDLKKLM